jgi:A/G-specific adenine glycosylase
MDGRYFSHKLVKWYLENKRSLPWRDTRDPYRIWLSEIILQQTRVSQGLPYYHRFLAQYPDVQSLAKASSLEVLRLWQGLGYYTRARNLHKCAKAVVALHNGKFPTTYRELLALPGIGDYTAAAIASFAFGEPVAVVDGNVFRILSRIFGLADPINTPGGRKKFNLLATRLLSTTEPDVHNQAVMEFGALYCTPATPKCEECGFKTSCFAYKHRLVNALPVKTPKKKSRNRYFFYLVIEKNKSLLMKKRHGRDIWEGLFDFALMEKRRPVKVDKLIKEAVKANQWLNAASEISFSRKYHHLLTHQVIHCRFITFRATADFKKPDKSMSFYTPAQVGRLPKPVLITRFLDERNAR